jgi:hypothetical protein
VLDKYPPVTIVMTIYFPEGIDGVQRRHTAYQTLDSWDDNLEYSGPLHLHIADDGSYCHFNPYWARVTESRQERHGVGASLNAGIRKAFETSDLVFHAVDDWILKKPFDLDPWVQVLIEREDIGLVRLGPPHPNIQGRVIPVSDNYQGWGLLLDRVYYAFATRPFLMHKRFIDAYGWFEEDTSAVECERLYNEHFCRSTGPDIIYALPHYWIHSGPTSMSEIEPERERT